MSLKLKTAWARVIFIGKEEAQKLLDRVFEGHQRPISESQVRRLLRDMDATPTRYIGAVGRIVVDGKNRLIDGQKVLTAFLRSKLKKLEVTYIFNPYENAYLAYDHGEKRTPNQDMKWAGKEPVSEPAVVIFQFEKGCYAGTAYTAARSAEDYPTSSELMEVEKMHPGIAAHMHKPPSIFRGRGIPMGALHASSYILHQYDRERAKNFFTSLFEGTDITAKSPIKVLRESLEERLGKKRLRNGEAVAWVFKAWNACLSNQILAKPILRQGEPFPELIPAPELPPRKGRVQ